ncbi:hypothetical protein KFB37_29000, partial [Klebsiella pneumoniae]|nr:hypothetical protein [Klebsiella pneumoniae]
VYRNASPLARIIRSSIFEYLTEADQQALLTTPGVNVIADYALKDAVADGVMVLDIPWNVGALNFGLDPATLPLGFQFIGWGCRRPYTIDDDNSFLNCGVVIRVAAGASFPFYSTGRHVFRDVVFDGRDKTTYLFYSPGTATQFNGTRLEGCGFYRFAIGDWLGFRRNSQVHRNNESIFLFNIRKRGWCQEFNRLHDVWLHNQC